MKVYTYVITNDRGAAPNYKPPATTLAICKPRIRYGAQPGDLVLAFTGRTFSPEPHAVCWAGVVTEKMTFAEYWKDPRFATKKPRAGRVPDNIYRPVKSGLAQVLNPSHGPGCFERDTGGQFVLAFDPNWHFGIGGPIIPAKFGLRMTRGRRGHRVAHLSSAKWRTLRRWLNDNKPIKTVVQPSPTDAKCAPRRPRRKCG